MVKRKGTVWKHWTIITEVENNEENSNVKKKTHPSVCCNYCSKTFEQGTSKRMQTHLNSCSKAPDNAKILPKQPPKILETTSTTTSTSIPIAKKQKKNLTNTTIENFIDRMGEEEQDTLEVLLAQALFAAGVPFSFLENDYVIQFFQRLLQHSNYLIEENLLMSCLMMFLMKSKLSVMNKFYKPILLQWFQMVGLILISNQYKILLFVLQNHYFLMLFILVKNLIQLNGLQTKLDRKSTLLNSSH